MSASISLLSPVGGVEATANYNALVNFYNSSYTLAGDSFLSICSYCKGLPYPFRIPFDATITDCSIMWQANNTPFDVRVYINDIMIQAISSTQQNEVLPFNVPVVTGDMMAVEISENPVTGIQNQAVWTGFVLEGV